MNNIIIYDTEHFETTYSLILLLDSSNNRLSIWTTPELERLLKEMLCEKSGKYVWKTKRNNLSFVWKLVKESRREHTSFVFLNTVSYHHLYFGIACLFFKSKSVLTIHAVNSFFSPKMRWSVKGVVQYIGKKILANNVSAYACLLSSTRQYIMQNLKSNKPVYILPGSVFNGKFNHSLLEDGKKLKLVVSGSIEQHRRNYEDVFELAQELERKHLCCSIVLLGAATGEYGKSILTKCQNVKLRFVTISYYKIEFVDECEYKTQLESCDFVFLPLQEFCFKPGEQLEKYGLTICSGSFFDAIKYAKPILLPKFISLSPEIASQCIPYNSIESLAVFLSTLSYSDKKEYVTQALNNSLNFTLKKIRTQLPNSFFD